MSHPLRAPANLIRRALIAMSLDRLLAERTYRNPDGLVARLFRPDISLYAGSIVRRVVRDGISYELDLSDYIEWTIYFGVERNLKSALFDLVQPGQTVVDVGTNVGEVLLNFARLVGPGGRAIGFEPNPATLAKCRRNLSFNDYPNVELHAEALGRQPGTVAFGRPAPTNAGADRVMPTGPATIDVRVTTLDQLLEEKPVDRLDLVKIDVEGFDLNVLRGGERTIARYRPTVFVELSDSNLREQGDSAVGLVRWLEDRDYLVEDAVTRTPVRSTDELSGCFRDVIATPA